MPADLDRLEQLARAATSGDREASPLGSEGYVVHAIDGRRPRMHQKLRIAMCGYLQWDEDKANAEFIAATDPLTVMELIVELRAWRTTRPTP
jgi:mRNA degradation ribonuclease J1/J2